MSKVYPKGKVDGIRRIHSDDRSTHSEGLNRGLTNSEDSTFKSFATDSIRRPVTGSGRLHDRVESAPRNRRPHSSLAGSSLLLRPKSLSSLIQQCDPGSESYPTTTELEFPDEWQKPTSVSSVSDRPNRCVSLRPKSVYGQSSTSTIQLERVGWNQRCLAALYGDDKGFRSPLTYIESKLRELRLRADLSKQQITEERTAESCDLLQRLCPSMGRLGEMLKEIAHELFLSIYVDFDPKCYSNQEPISFPSLTSYYAANKLKIEVIRSLQVYMFSRHQYR